ncbi:MAG: GntR family transcriptional regulator [Gemmiger sp.]|nr:GntR family transcriptional regulator [Gemmiger sp.]
MPQSFSSHDIFETLYTEIMTLVLKPGDTLRENELCARFGVSRTPVRSVLQELRIHGLVEVTPYKSTHVTQLDFDTISQQIYLRVAVEGAVLADYCAVATPEQLAGLRARNEVLRKLATSPDPQNTRFYALDSRLHQSWFTAMRKEHLWQQIQTAQNHYSRFRMLDLVGARNFGEIVAEHDELLDALSRRDTPAVQAIIRKHLYGGVARLSQALPTKFAAYFVPGTRWPESQPEPPAPAQG